MIKKRFYILIFAMFFAAPVLLAQDGRNQSVNIENNIFSNDLNEKNRIELYPNPAVDYLVVEISNSSLKNAEFELHSIIGNKIRIQPEEIGQNRYRIPVKDFASGYYFLVVKDEISRFKKAYKFLKN